MDDPRAGRESGVTVFWLAFVPIVLAVGVIDEGHRGWIDRSYGAPTMTILYASGLAAWLYYLAKWWKKT
jgi:hypothetical protein